MPVLGLHGRVEPLPFRRVGPAAETGIESHAARIEGTAGVGARARGLTVYSNYLKYPALARLVRETLRARALSRFVRTMELEAPETGRPVTFLVMRSVESYQRWFDLTFPVDSKPEEVRKAGRNYAFFRNRARYVVCHPRDESWLKSVLFLCAWMYWSSDQYGGRVQACLTMGHVGWVAAHYLGVPLPLYESLEGTERGTRGLTTAKPRRQAGREWIRHLAQAGPHGSRAWVRYLVERGEDPPWRESMMDRLANIGGTNRMKSMFVAEYLQESGVLDETLRKSTDTGRPPPEMMREALGKSFGKFEEEWRAWFREDAGLGVIQMLDGAGGSPEDVDSAAAQALRHLDSIRARALGSAPKLWLDPALSAGALAHCRYLRLHPDQAGSWPEVHEEYSDRDGFSASGSWAARNSVINPGASGPVKAIDGWMGTVYHRFPLLRPGLAGIGWAQADGFAVLDADSLVLPPPETRWVGWPPPDGRDVPRRFAAAGERPHPVPGEDQARWGYPITLQLFGYERHAAVEMELIGADKQKVECHYSTPDRPTNEKVAPAECFFLIPRQRLRAKTKYTVVVRNLPDGTSASWTFRTR